jgi:hypothetical protein
MYMAKMMLINDIRNCRIIKIDGIFLEFIPLFEEMTYNLMQKTIGKLHTCDTFKNVNIDRYRQILPAAQKWLKSYTFTNKKYYYPGTIGIYDIISNEKVIIANDMNKPLFLKLKYVLAEIIETTLLITRSKNPPHESPLPHDDSIWALLKYYVMPKMEEMEKNGIYHMHTTATKECIEFINAMLKILFEKKKDSSSAIDKFSITLKGKEVEFVNCSIDEFWFTITEYFESVGYNSTKIWLQPMQDWEFYMWRISYNKSHKLISI